MTLVNLLDLTFDELALATLKEHGSINYLDLNFPSLWVENLSRE